jgi:phenylacetate-CoA ligase
MISTALELRRLLRNRYLSPPKLRALQESKLRALIRHSYDNVPHYRSLFRSAGLYPEDVRTIEDLQHVPVTTKDDLRAPGAESAIAEGVDLSSCYSGRTSGTTGQPFVVYLSAQEARTRQLVRFRALLTAGFGPRDRLCVLRPRSHAPGFLGRLGLYRQEHISSFLSLPEQIRHLQRTQPTVFIASPTELKAILHEVDYRLGEIIRPRMFINYLEVMDEGLAKRLKADTGAEMFNFYDSAEFAEIASDCPAHQGLHVNADQLILECLDDDGEPARPGEPGVVVITRLSGYTMPFIRYRLGDISTSVEKQCPCGSSFPLIGPPVGREYDLVRLPSGRILPTIPLFRIVNKLDGIEQYRIIQESHDHFVLLMVPRDNPEQAVLSDLRARLIRYLGEPAGFDIQIVDFMQEDAPKFKKFISKLPPSDP